IFTAWPTAKPSARQSPAVRVILLVAATNATAAPSVSVALGDAGASALPGPRSAQELCVHDAAVAPVAVGVETKIPISTAVGSPGFEGLVSAAYTGFGSVGPGAVFARTASLIRSAPAPLSLKSSTAPLPSLSTPSAVSVRPVSKRFQVAPPSSLR